MTTNSMLFEDVPLATTEVLGDYQETGLIAHHYGDLRRSRVRCQRITGTMWLVSAHPWQAIDFCYLGGVRIQGWSAVRRTDIDKVTRQYVQLNTAAPPNLTVEVSGQAKMNPISGKLLENPDEIIEDIAKLGGKTLSFPLFREACNQRNLKVAGSVYRAQSIRAYIKEIIDSCGAKWLGDNIVFYPKTIDYAAEINFPSELNHTLSLEDVAGTISLFYGWNHARDQNGGFLQMEAVGSRYTNKAVYEAKWLRQPKDAEALATRLLGKRAGQFIKTTAKVPGVVRAGDDVILRSRSYQGPMTILTAQNNGVETDITGEVIISAYTNLRLTRFSAEVLSKRGERIEVSFSNGQAELTILDTQGRAMAGIFVALDQGTAKKTNDKGSVSFVTSPGEHQIALSGPGIDPEPFPIYIK